MCCVNEALLKHSQSIIMLLPTLHSCSSVANKWIVCLCISALSSALLCSSGSRLLTFITGHMLKSLPIGLLNYGQNPYHNYIGQY